MLKNKHGMAKDRYGHNPEEPARSRRNFTPAMMCDKYWHDQWISVCRVWRVE